MFGIMTAFALDTALARGQVYLDLPPEVVLTSTLEAFEEGYAIGQFLHIRRISDDPFEVEISSIRANVNDPGCDDRQPDCLPNLAATMRIGPSLQASLTLVGDHRAVDQMPMAELAAHLQQPTARARQEGESWFVGDLRFDEMSLRQVSDARYLIGDLGMSITETGGCVLHQLASAHRHGADDPAIRDMLDAISVIADRERQYRPMPTVETKPPTFEGMTELAIRMMPADEADWPHDLAGLVAMPPIAGFVAQYDGFGDYLANNYERIIGAARYMRRSAA